jgi:hypothetical protein
MTRLSRVLAITKASARRRRAVACVTLLQAVRRRTNDEHAYAARTVAPFRPTSKAEVKNWWAVYARIDGRGRRIGVGRSRWAALQDALKETSQ